MQRERFGIRLGATVIDVVAIIVASLIIQFVFGLVAGKYVAGLVGALFALAYTSLEIFKAATPGKMVLKLQILDENGAIASQQQLIKRWAFKNASSVFGVLAALTTLRFFNWIGGLIGLGVFVGCFMVLKAQRQAWHDTFAKTGVYRQSPAPVAAAEPAPAAAPAPERQAA